MSAGGLNNKINNTAAGVRTACDPVPVTTATLTHRVTTTDGVHHAACSLKCARSYYVATAASHGGQASLRVDPLAPTASCAHCSWCGRLASQPTSCRLHAGDCPPADWLVTDAARRAVGRLLADAGLRALPPRAWAYLEQAAGYQQQAGLRPDAEALRRAVWDVRVDWLR